jgi:carbon storage regulator
MLVLTRKQYETITFLVGDEEVTIAVVQVKGKQVRIGINAPQKIAIYRTEVLERIESGKVEPRRKR